MSGSPLPGMHRIQRFIAPTAHLSLRLSLPEASRSDHSQHHACAILQRLKVEHVHRDQGEHTKAGLKGKQRVSFC